MKDVMKDDPTESNETEYCKCESCDNRGMIKIAIILSVISAILSFLIQVGIIK
jgi:hypothetical protein